MKGNRILILVGVLVVAVIVGYVAFKGGFPPKSGTEGAIGAANRHTTQQIADADVVLKEPQVQAFLQSDTFHKLATNAEFRNEVTKEEFLAVVREEAYQRVATKEQWKDVASTAAFQGIASTDALQYVAGMLSQGSATTREALASVVNSDAFAALAGKQEFIEALGRNPKIKGPLQILDWKALGTGDAFSDKATKDAYMAMVDSKSFKLLAGITGFDQLLTSEALRTPGRLQMLRELVKDEKLGTLAEGGDLMTLAGSDNFKGACRYKEFLQLQTADAFLGALKDGGFIQAAGNSDALRLAVERVKD
jgi:hypothetical protein